MTRLGASVPGCSLSQLLNAPMPPSHGWMPRFSLTNALSSSDPCVKKVKSTGQIQCPCLHCCTVWYSAPAMPACLFYFRGSYTGGKDQFTRLVHHKYITRKWTKYLGCTHLVHPKYIQNFPCQFSCNFPGVGNSQGIHSVLDHMTVMFPLCN